MCTRAVRSVPRFVDTNLLLYSISRDPAEAAKREIAVSLLDQDDLALSVQVIDGILIRDPFRRG